MITLATFHLRKRRGKDIWRLTAMVAVLGAAAAHAQTLAPGSGAATPAIEQSFINAYNRGSFPLVTPQATTPVRALSGASPALVQEFGPSGAAAGTPRSALIKADPNAAASATDTLQVYSDVYALYQSVGAGTAGLPLSDTLTCPPNTFGVCTYQQFSKNYALFVYSTGGSPAFSVADPFYTLWTANGGVSGILGVATAASSAVTSSAGTSGTQQTFVGGAIYSYTLSGKATVLAVSGPIYNAFSASGDAALVGFPTSTELTLVSGIHRQTFEGARIEWTPGATAAVVYFPITNLDILGEAQGATISAGQSVMLTATTLDSHNNSVTNRAFNWSTANGSVATVVGNGVTAVVTGVASGTTNIYVSAEGKTSPPFPVTVRGVCCNIGEGAPTQAITLAFKTAATRNNLNVTLPNPTAVTRSGAGYVQVFSAADGSGTVYAIALSDKGTAAYVLSGAVYAAYLSAGGFGGSLGYPSSDLLAGGTQTFESGVALTGNPVQLVPAAVAKRWLSSGGAAGALGAVAGAAAAFTAFDGSAGMSQVFAGGAVYAYTSGARAGEAFVSSGPILARYLALSGPGGALGGPTSDVVGAGAVASQNFEGGYIDLQSGAAAAVEHLNPRKPAVSVQPSTVAPGGKVRVNLSGFAQGGQISVTVTGQAAFVVSPASGAFSWEIAIGGSAKPATIAVQAKSSNGSDVANASYTISPVLSLLPRWKAVSGDRQTGPPGAALQLPLAAVLVDADGNPIPNTAVNVMASPGAVVTGPAATGSDGSIAVTLRLPPAAGAAVVSFTAAGQVVTFSALASATAISGFPVFSAADGTLLGTGPATFAQQGSLLYTLAALIRYQQINGLLVSPNGLATPVALNQYLVGRGGFTLSDGGAPIANPWLAARFAGSGAVPAVGAASLETIRDVLGAGTPLGVVLNLTIDGVAAGTTTVSAIGTDAGGGILISDPNPAYARQGIGDYLGGFSAGGHRITATLGLLLRMTTSTGSGGFVVTSALSAGIAARSAAGACSGTDLSGARFLFCDETQSLYEVALQAGSGGTVIDLTEGSTPISLAGSSGRAFLISRSGGVLKADPERVAITAVTDGAVFGNRLAPGGIFTIFGTGFTPEISGTPTVTVNGQGVSLLVSLPFQINAQLPAGLTAGEVAIKVTNSLGSADWTATVSDVAPEIFVLGTNAAGGQLGAIVNQDGSVNSPALPAVRGQFISIYCTGLGATVVRGNLAETVSQVTAVVSGVTLQPSFSGLAPGFVGLYQVNVTIPGSMFPSAAASLRLEEAGQASNTVVFGLQ